MTGFFYNDKEIRPGTPEADELARKVLTALYACAAAAQGGRLERIEIEKTEKEES